MSNQTTDWTALLSAVESLRSEVARLNERVAALETTGQVAAASAAKPVEVQPVSTQVDEQLVLVISAAIAAFLGKKAPIRQIRLLGSSAWSQQGRVTIQASHNL